MLATILWFIGSAIAVDLSGYFLHRWSHKPHSFIYKPHMTHHVVNYPPKDVFSAKYRSSRSDGLVIWFAPFGIIYIVAVLVMGASHPWAIIAGGGVVAVLSSIAHDMSHLTGSIMWKRGWFSGIAIRHHVHHFKMGRNFGILSPIWDNLFGTRHLPAATSRLRSRPYGRVPKG